MISKKNIIYIIIIILLLTICLAASIGYIIGNSNATTIQQNIPPSNIQNSYPINSEINNLKSIYNSKIDEKINAFKELELEKNKVQELLLALEQAQGNANSMLKYKERYQNLEDKMRLLVREIGTLRGNKIKAISHAKESKKVRNQIKKTTNTIQEPIAKIETQAAVKNEIDSEKKIEAIANELKVTNFEAVAYKKKSSNKNEITPLARKVDFIRISYTVVGNSNSLPEEKKYYIQVVNSKNNILGTKITEYIDGYVISYSTKKVVKFEGKNIPVEYDLIDNNFEKGNYFISLFDRSKLVAKSQINLD